MHCRHCGNRLPIIRSLSRGEFCSEQHRQLFVELQQHLAFVRLLEHQRRAAQKQPFWAEPEQSGSGGGSGHQRDAEQRPRSVEVLPPEVPPPSREAPKGSDGALLSCRLAPSRPSSVVQIPAVPEQLLPAMPFPAPDPIPLQPWQSLPLSLIGLRPGLDGGLVVNHPDLPLQNSAGLPLAGFVSLLPSFALRPVKFRASRPI